MTTIDHDALSKALNELPTPDAFKVAMGRCFEALGWRPELSCKPDGVYFDPECAGVQAHPELGPLSPLRQAQPGELTREIVAGALVLKIGDRWCGLSSPNATRLVSVDGVIRMGAEAAVCAAAVSAKWTKYASTISGAMRRLAGDEWNPLGHRADADDHDSDDD